MDIRETAGRCASYWVRRFRAGVWVCALASGLLLVGCAAEKKAEPVAASHPQLQVPRSAQTIVPVIATAPAPQMVTPETRVKPLPKAEPLKVLFLYVGPVGDGGWTFAHEAARKELVRALGDKIQTTYVENVPESEAALRVLRDGVTRGNTLVFGTTFGYMEPMLKAASEFKGVKFEHATGYKQAANMRTYDGRTYEGAYLAGVIAGKMTKTNTLGVVASIPIPEVIRNINSFTLGAQSSNPKIRTKVVWVNEWFNPPKEAAAANSLMDGDADILFQNTDSPAVLQAAQERGKRAIGWDSDMTAYGPKAHLASSIINWGPYYIQATKAVLDGSWKGGSGSWLGVKDGAIDIVSIAEDVPAETKAKLEKVKKGLAEGTFTIWKSSLKDNTGKDVLKNGGTADDKFLSGMNFYVQGVEGKVPGAK
jgi:basic membrane protein A